MDTVEVDMAGGKGDVVPPVGQQVAESVIAAAAAGTFADVDEEVAGVGGECVGCEAGVVVGSTEHQHPVGVEFELFDAALSHRVIVRTGDLVVLRP